MDVSKLSLGYVDDMLIFVADHLSQKCYDV